VARTMLILALLAGLAAAGEIHALLVGCTEYPNLKSRRDYKAWIELYGPANDVALMKETLIRYLKVDPERVTALSGWPKDEAQRPTRHNIVAHLKRLAREVKAGDRVIFHFAGHGSQQPDTDGDELDGLDEILLPADIGKWNGAKREVQNSITDDQLAALLEPIRRKGAFVWVLVDCCHAGTISRAPGDEIRTRQIAPDILGVPRARGKRADSAPPADFSNIVSIYAVEARDKAPEVPLPRGAAKRRYHGMLSWYIAAHLQRTGGALTFRELHARVLASFRDHPRIRAVPQIEGQMDRTILATKGGGPPPMLVTHRGDKLVASAGRLHGLRTGSVLTLRDDTGNKLGRVRVESAGIAESVVVAVGKLAEFDVARARIAEQPLGDLRLKVAVVGGKASELPTGPQWTYVTEKDADWRIIVRPDKTMALEPVDGAGARFELQVGEVKGRLKQVFRWQTLRRIASDGRLPAMPKELSCEMLVDGKPIKPGATLHPGDSFSVRLFNRSKHQTDVTVLVLDADCGSQSLIEQTLPANATRAVELGPYDIHDGTQGVEHLLVLAVPRAPGAGPAYFGWFAQDGLPRTQRGEGGAKNLRDLLATMKDGRATRGGVPAGEAYGALITWRTAWPEVHPPKAFLTAPVPVPTTRACMRALTSIDRGGWQPESARVRMRGGSEVYAKTAPSVVVVRTRRGHGTGFLVGPKLVLTNRHVIGEGYTTSNTGRPRVTVHRGDTDREGWIKLREQGAPAEVVAWDAERDLALLKVSAPDEWFKNMTPIELAPAGPKPHQEIFLIGHPASGMLWSLRHGRAAAVGRMPHDVVDRVVAVLNVEKNKRARIKAMLQKRRGVRIILGDLGANPGDSGSPLLDAKGRLLGVTYAIPRDVRMDKFVYHVHRDEVQAFLATARPAGPLVPDPWDLGPNITMVGADVLVAGTAKPEQILIDIDGDAKPGGDLEAIVQKRSFDAEAAFHFADGRRTAFYDTNNDGTFDLILVDEDDDPDADVSYKLVGAQWVVRTDIADPWLGSGYLEFDGGATKAREKFKKVLVGK